VDKYRPFGKDCQRTLQKVKSALSKEVNKDEKMSQLVDLGQRIAYLARKKTELQTPI